MTDSDQRNHTFTLTGPPHAQGFKMLRAACHIQESKLQVTVNTERVRKSSSDGSVAKEFVFERRFAFDVDPVEFAAKVLLALSGKASASEAGIQSSGISFYVKEENPEAPLSESTGDTSVRVRKARPNWVISEESTHWIMQGMQNSKAKFLQNQAIDRLKDFFVQLNIKVGDKIDSRVADQLTELAGITERLNNNLNPLGYEFIITPAFPTGKSEKFRFIVSPLALTKIFNACHTVVNSDIRTRFIGGLRVQKENDFLLVATGSSKTTKIDQHDIPQLLTCLQRYLETGSDGTPYTQLSNGILLRQGNKKDPANQDIIYMNIKERSVPLNYIQAAELYAFL